MESDMTATVTRYIPVQQLEGEVELIQFQTKRELSRQKKGEGTKEVLPRNRIIKC